MTEVLKREDFMEDSRGRMVPIAMVDEIDQQRDSLVRELVDGAKALQAAMGQFKDRAMGDVQAFVDFVRRALRGAPGRPEGQCLPGQL